MIKDAHNIFAWITGNIVQRVVVDITYGVSDMSAKQLYGDIAYAVQSNRYKVKPGDIYQDGKFYRKNESSTLEELPYLQTQLDELLQLKEESYQICTAIKQLKEAKTI